MLAFTSHINSNGQSTINFTNNICPSGSMAIENEKETIDVTF